MKEYYKDLKPKDRINIVMKEYVEPCLSELGFKYFPSVMSFKKKHGDFTYRLELISSHRNQTDIWCGFNSHAYITAHNYSKWHKKHYGENVDYAFIIGKKDEDIPGYDLSDYMSGPINVRVEVNDNQTEPEIMNIVMGHNLATDDNQDVVDSFLNNFKDAVIPYFNKVTNYIQAIDEVMKGSYYFKTPRLMDFCEILGDELKANEVYRWFEIEKQNGTDFSEEILDKVSFRKERLDKGYNK